MSDDKLRRLMGRCKCGVYVRVNEHRNMYETAAQAMEKQTILNNGTPQCSPDVLQKMIEMDTIVCVQCYPNTPIGFYDAYHYDIDAALDSAHRQMDADGRP